MPVALDIVVNDTPLMVAPNGALGSRLLARAIEQEGDFMDEAFRAMTRGRFIERRIDAYLHIDTRSLQVGRDELQDALDQIEDEHDIDYEGR